MRKLRLHKRKRDAKKVAAIKGRPSQKQKSSAPTAGKAKRTKMSELEAKKEEIEAEGVRELQFCATTLMIFRYLSSIFLWRNGVIGCFEAGRADVPQAST